MQPKGLQNIIFVRISYLAEAKLINVSTVFSEVYKKELGKTDDVDITIDLINYTAWVQMQERLAALGFSPDSGGHSICSYLYKV